MKKAAQRGIDASGFKTLVPSKVNINRQYAQQDPQHGVFEDLERQQSNDLDREMAQKPRWENDTLTDQMQFVNKINKKQNEYAYLDDFAAIE